MKNSSLILNIVLLIAVAILFVLHFSGENTSLAGSEKNEGSLAVRDSSGVGGMIVAYVNVDTLFARYNQIKDYNTKALARQTAAESEYRNATTKFQEEYMQLQQQASQGMISESKFNMEQQALQKKQEAILKMEERINTMLENHQTELKLITSGLYASFRDYNKEKKYDYILSYSENGGQILFGDDAYNITDEVIAFLNEQNQTKK